MSRSKDNNGLKSYSHEANQGPNPALPPAPGVGKSHNMYYEV